jgi:hypothetical protein
MVPISAVNAISAAVERTRDFLFRPFRWGTFLKLGLVAIVTEGVGSNFNSSHGGRAPEHGPAPHSPFTLPLAGQHFHSPFNLGPEGIVVIVAAVLLALLLSGFVVYLITRLRFAYFHCLIHNVREIRPGWYLYREQATRFFWFNVVVGVCFLLVVALVAIPFAAGFWRLFHQIPPGGHPDWGALLALILPLIPIVIVLALAGVLTDIILRDWMLPHYALDDASAGEAWDWVWENIKAEKREFFVYTVLRLILPTIATIALFVVLLIPGAMVAGSIAALEYGVHSAFAGTSGGSWVAGVFLEVFFGVVAFGFILLLGICLGGPLSTGIRQFALMFYGGRYPALGNILFPPPPPTPVGLGGAQSA